MVFCILVEKVAPFLAFWFGFVVVVVVFAFELVHILDIVQNVDIDGRNVSVLDCEDVAVSDGIVVWKFVSVSIKGYHETVAVGAFFVKFIYGQFVWGTDHRFETNACIVCVVEFHDFGLGIVYCDRDVEVPVTFVFVVAGIRSILCKIIF